MTLVVWLFAVQLVIVGVSYLHPVWQIKSLRIGLSLVSFVLLVALAATLCVLYPSWWSAFAVVIILYRCFNELRIIKGRMNLEYIRRQGIRSDSILTIAEICFIYLAFALADISNSGRLWIATMAGVQAMAGILLLMNTVRMIKRTRYVAANDNDMSSQSSTVSVCIPARNETTDLEECLKSVLASDYPKLEVIVYDDCSQTRRTPEIIRKFAHDGVRFIQGMVPRDDWLAKNAAYDKLQKEASGEILLFCGVDVRFQPETIRQLVSLMSSRNKRVVSIMPLREYRSRFEYSLIQTVRYLWELTPPRRLFNRPPVLSSCWLIRRRDLAAAGGFAAVKNTITPEAHFARSVIKHDGYSFVRADEALGLTSVKSFSAQRATAVRTRYPALHRKLEMLLLIATLELFLLVGPLVLFTYGFLTYALGLTIVAATACLCVFLTYAIVTTTTRTTSVYLLPIMALPTILSDIILMHVSFYKYEFSEVIWKGRNVCVPVMEVIPELPNIDKQPTDLGMSQ